jgi:simple sugar transport system permease protein
VSEPPESPVDPKEATPELGRGTPSVAERLALWQKAGGVVTPIITALLAFLIGGLVVLATTGKNPLSTYKGIFQGTGLNWLFPWVTGDDRITAALNLQQTLLVTTPLILTGLAVAFAFRCGLFNIGGQGQYIVGSIVAVWVGSSWAGLAGPRSRSRCSRGPSSPASPGSCARPSGRTR